MSTTSFEKQVLPPNFIEENKQPEPEDNLMMYSSQKLSKNDFAKESEGMATSLPPGFIERRVSDETTFIMSQSMHMNKPIMRFETTLAINIYQIKEVFEKVCKKRGFEIVDDEGDQITAVNKKMLGLKDLILSCIPGPSRSYQNLTAVRLHSKTNKVTCMRKITLKALLGDMKLANTLFLDFEKELEAFNGKRIGISPRQNGLSVLSENVMTVSVNFRGAKYVQMKDDINGDGDESVISTQNLESSSFYEFRKILSSEQYSIGKKAADFVKDFAASYKSVTESAELLPQPMESVYLLVNEITETFFADFNYGKSETKQMMPFCRISVEKYIFDKVYAQLFAMYVAKYNKNTLKYEARATQIIANSDVISQLKYLDISVKFWLIPKGNLDENNNLKQPIEPDQIPYMESIQELNKLSSLKSPREKLGTLLMMHSLMKSAVVDFHKGKEEVCSMDEELPILIYIVLHARLKDIHAEFNFVDDYVQFDPALESEKRLMTNLKVSLQYIADEWGN